MGNWAQCVSLISTLTVNFKQPSSGISHILYMQPYKMHDEGPLNKPQLYQVSTVCGSWFSLLGLITYSPTHLSEYRCAKITFPVWLTPTVSRGYGDDHNHPFAYQYLSLLHQSLEKKNKGEAQFYRLPVVLKPTAEKLSWWAAVAILAPVLSWIYHTYL